MSKPNEKLIWVFLSRLRFAKMFYLFSNFGNLSVTHTHIYSSQEHFLRCFDALQKF